MPFFTYIIKSQTHGNFYYGSTENVDKRLTIHNAGKVRYTKGRRPWVIHYVEEFNTRSEAVKREMFFKSIPGYQFLKAKNII